MSALHYINEEGAGQKHSDLGHYSQVVLIQPTKTIVRCSGQGGWDNTGKMDKSNVKLQVDNAFDNVDRILRAAGCRGWEDVHNIRSYHVDIGHSFQLMVDKLRERIPEFRPTWTSIGVTRLAFDEMLIEIEVEATKPE